MRKNISQILVCFLLASCCITYVNAQNKNKKKAPIKTLQKKGHGKQPFHTHEIWSSAPNVTVHFGVQQTGKPCTPGASVCGAQANGPTSNDSSTANKCTFYRDSSDANSGVIYLLFSFWGLNNPLYTFFNTGCTPYANYFTYTLQSPLTLTNEVHGLDSNIVIDSGTVVTAYGTSQYNIKMAFLGVEAGHSCNMGFTASGEAPSPTLSISNVNDISQGCACPVYMYYQPDGDGDDSATITMYFSFNSSTTGRTPLYNSIQGMDTTTNTAGQMVLNADYTFEDGNTCGVPSGTVIPAGTYNVNSFGLCPVWGSSSKFYYPGWARMYLHIQVSSGSTQNKFKKPQKKKK